MSQRVIAAAVCALLVGSLGSVVPAPPVARADYGTLYLSDDEVPVGTTLHLHGTGFTDFSKITNQLDISVYTDAGTVERGSVAASPDGIIDVAIDTGDGNYGPGEYGVLASYTYWGTRRDAAGQIVCSPCPVQTLPLADPVSFVLD